MQKNKIWKRIFSGLLLFILLSGLAGCGKEKGISLEEMPGGVQAEQDDADKKEADIKEESADKEKAGKKAEEQEPPDKEAEESGSKALSVYVCGAVHAPGVYELPAGSRLYQAVDAAGGMREDADRDYLNLAMELTDGMKLQVPTKDEVTSGSVSGEEQTFEMKEGASKENSSDTSGLVNINTADEARLMTLPGIGEAKAKSIIAYREEKGAFKKTEDIMNITGIKQAVYDKIKAAICVN